MKDTDILYNCIFDMTYKDKLQLEIIIGRILDRRLIVGFLSDLWAKSDIYEVDKKIPIMLLSQIIKDNKPLTHGEVSDDNKYFMDKMRPINESKTKYNSVKIDILTLLLSGIENDELTPDGINNLENMLSTCDKEHLILFKEFLLEEEMFEYIKHFDKFI